MALACPDHAGPILDVAPAQLARAGSLKKVLWHICLGFALLSPGPSVRAASETDARGNACGSPGEWVRPADRSVMPPPFQAAAQMDVVLLGEQHDSPEDHRWQLQALAALHSYRREIVLGFEMFPRRLQPVLDDWVAGELDPAAFLDAVDWRQIWGFPADLYLPLFHFARMNRVPMVALDVDRALVRRIGREGLAAVPKAEHEGVGAPTPALPQYRAHLEEVFGQHPGGDLESFIEAQLFRDRAMAQAIAAVRQRPEPPLVVGIVGAGHVEFGWGIPHQLAQLGIRSAASYLTFDAKTPCVELEAGLADAVFLLDPPGAET